MFGEELEAAARLSIVLSLEVSSNPATIRGTASALRLDVSLDPFPSLLGSGLC